MEKQKTILSVDEILNPKNAIETYSFSSCEDRCNKLEVRRSKTNGSYS